MTPYLVIAVLLALVVALELWRRAAVDRIRVLERQLVDAKRETAERTIELIRARNHIENFKGSASAAKSAAAMNHRANA